MKENKKSGKKGIIITLGIAVIMIALCAVFLNTVLAQAAQPAENDVQSEPISQTLNTEAVDPAAQENLTIIVDNNGKEPPADGVTAQYAVAVTSEVAQRVYGKELTGRVMVHLGEWGGPNEGLHWNVMAQVADGVMNCTVNTASGVDIQAGYDDGFGDWSWFDNWDAEAIEQERQANEAAQPATGPDGQELTGESIDEADTFTEAELTELYQMKRQGMLDFAAEMKGKPHGEKAVELVNTLGIGDGAKAVSGDIMMQGCYNDHMTYLVEVALDNGKYVIVTLDQDSMEFLAYERYDANMAQAMYG